MRRFTKCVSNSCRIFIKKIKVGSREEKKREECFYEWIHSAFKWKIGYKIYTTVHQIEANKRAFARFWAFFFLCCFASFFPTFDFTNKNINKNELHPNVYMLNGNSIFFRSIFSVHENLMYRNMCDATISCALFFSFVKNILLSDTKFLLQKYIFAGYFWCGVLLSIALIIRIKRK